MTQQLSWRDPGDSAQVEVHSFHPLPVSVPDPADPTGTGILGSSQDAAVTTDAAGKIQQYLRGLVKIFANVWNSTNGYLNVFSASSAGALSAPNVNGANVSILAANTARKGAAITNEGPSTCYVTCSSTTSSTTAYTAQVIAGGYYEVPSGYTGLIAGSIVANNAQLRVTEFT